MPIETPTQPAVEPKPKAAPLTAKDYKGKVEPDWCPGCGDFGVLSALQTALAELGLQPHQVVTISGIGCSSNLPGYVNTYGMHTLHGRAVAVASGVQLSNHKLKVIVTGGDGDGYGIGGNHFIHCMRRNYDLTYLVMNNEIYGLTTGQCSPTSLKGAKTKSTPFGSVENPLNPIALAIAGGGTYVARGFSGNQNNSSNSSKAASTTAASRSSTSSARASPTTRTRPTNSSVRASKTSPRRNTTHPTSTPRWIAPSSGATRFPSASSGNAPTSPRSTNSNPCWTQVAH